MALQVRKWSIGTAWQWNRYRDTSARRHVNTTYANKGEAVLQIKVKTQWIFYQWFLNKKTNGEANNLQDTTDLAGTSSKEHPAWVTQLSCETQLPVLKTMLGELVSWSRLALLFTSLHSRPSCHCPLRGKKKKKRIQLSGLWLKIWTPKHLSGFCGQQTCKPQKLDGPLHWVGGDFKLCHLIIHTPLRKVSFWLHWPEMCFCIPPHAIFTVVSYLL